MRTIPASDRRTIPMRLSGEGRERGRRQVGRGGRGGRDRRILDRKSLGCLSNGGSAAMAAAAAAQCFALGIFDCRITNETPTFGIIVRRPDTSSWAAAADAKEQLNSFVNLLLSLSLSSAKGGREGRCASARPGGHVEHDTSWRRRPPSAHSLVRLLGATAFL